MGNLSKPCLKNLKRAGNIVSAPWVQSPVLHAPSHTHTKEKKRRERKGERKRKWKRKKGGREERKKK